MGIPSHSTAAKDDSGSMAIDSVSRLRGHGKKRLTSRYLAVASLAQMQTWEAARGQIEYNLTHLRQGVRRILEALET
jgi:hypothetical protein